MNAVSGELARTRVIRDGRATGYGESKPGPQRERADGPTTPPVARSTAASRSIPLSSTLDQVVISDPTKGRRQRLSSSLPAAVAVAVAALAPIRRYLGEQRRPGESPRFLPRGRLRACSPPAGSS